MKPTLKELKPLLPYFSRYCINRYEATLPNGKTIYTNGLKRHINVEKYVEPVSPNGKLRLSKPKYFQQH